jgi:hypothetical protein
MVWMMSREVAERFMSRRIASCAIAHVVRLRISRWNVNGQPPTGRVAPVAWHERIMVCLHGQFLSLPFSEDLEEEGFRPGKIFIRAI